MISLEVKEGLNTIDLSQNTVRLSPWSQSASRDLGNVG